MPRVIRPLQLIPTSNVNQEAATSTTTETTNANVNVTQTTTIPTPPIHLQPSTRPPTPTPDDISPFASADEIEMTTRTRSSSHTANIGGRTLRPIPTVPIRTNSKKKTTRRVRPPVPTFDEALMQTSASAKVPDVDEIEDASDQRQPSLKKRGVTATVTTSTTTTPSSSAAAPPLPHQTIPTNSPTPPPAIVFNVTSVDSSYIKIRRSAASTSPMQEDQSMATAVVEEEEKKTETSVTPMDTSNEPSIPTPTTPPLLLNSSPYPDRGLSQPADVTVTDSLTLKRFIPHDLEVPPLDLPPFLTSAQRDQMEQEILQHQESTTPFAPRQRVLPKLSLPEPIDPTSSFLASLPELQTSLPDSLAQPLFTREFIERAEAPHNRAVFGELTQEQKDLVYSGGLVPVIDQWQCEALAHLRIEVDRELIEDRESELIHLDDSAADAMNQLTLDSTDPVVPTSTMPFTTVDSSLMHSPRPTSRTQIEVMEDEDEKVIQPAAAAPTRPTMLDPTFSPKLTPPTSPEPPDFAGGGSVPSEEVEPAILAESSEEEAAMMIGEYNATPAETKDVDMDEVGSQVAAAAIASEENMHPENEPADFTAVGDQSLAAPEQLQHRVEAIQSIPNAKSTQPTVGPIETISKPTPSSIPTSSTSLHRIPTPKPQPQSTSAPYSPLPTSAQASTRQPFTVALPATPSIQSPNSEPVTSQPTLPVPSSIPPIVASPQPMPPPHKKAKLNDSLPSPQVAPQPSPLVSPSKAKIFTPIISRPVTNVMTPIKPVSTTITSTSDQPLSAYEHRVEVDEECFNVHALLYQVLQNVWPSLVAGGSIKNDQQALQEWTPVKVMKLIGAKHRHLMTVGRSQNAGAELRLAQKTWRALQVLHYCVCVSWKLIHCGIHSAWWFTRQMESQIEWVNTMKTVEATTLTAVCGEKLIQPIRKALRALCDRVVNGAIWDSPKVMALLKLFRTHHFMRNWQPPSPLSALNQSPVSGVTVILVQSPQLARTLKGFIHDQIKSDVIDGPIESKIGEPPMTEAQKFLRLFSQYPVVIGLASYLLPHESFPWQSVSTLIHYDSLDPYQFWNQETGESFQPSAMVQTRIKNGSMSSWALVSEVESSRVLWPPEDRLLEDLKLPPNVGFQLLIDETWISNHQTEEMLFVKLEIGLIRRTMKPITMILDATTAVVVFEFEELLQHYFNDKSSQAQLKMQLDFTINELVPFSARVHTIHCLLYDPNLKLIRGSEMAKCYTAIEEQLKIRLSDEMSETVNRSHTVQRIRTPMELLLTLLRLIKQTAEQKGQLDKKASWYDRGWLSPYVTNSEQFLAEQPSLNYFIAQYVLNYLGMTVGDFMNLSIDEAMEKCQEGIPRQQLLRCLTHAQHLVRQPQAPLNEPVLSPRFGEPEDELLMEHDTAVQPIPNLSQQSRTIPNTAATRTPTHLPLPRQHVSDYRPRPSPMVTPASTDIFSTVRRDPTSLCESAPVINRKRHYPETQRPTVEAEPTRAISQVKPIPLPSRTLTPTHSHRSLSSSSMSGSSGIFRHIRPSTAELMDADRSTPNVTEGTLTTNKRKRGTSSLSALDQRALSGPRRDDNGIEILEELDDEDAREMEEIKEERRRHPILQIQETEVDEEETRRPSKRSALSQHRQPYSSASVSGGSRSSRSLSSGGYATSVIDEGERHRQLMEETHGKKTRLGFERANQPVLVRDDHGRVKEDRSQTRLRMTNVPLSPRTELPTLPRIMTPVRLPPNPTRPPPRNFEPPEQTLEDEGDELMAEEPHTYPSLHLASSRSRAYRSPSPVRMDDVDDGDGDLPFAPSQPASRRSSFEHYRLRRVSPPTRPPPPTYTPIARSTGPGVGRNHMVTTQQRTTVDSHSAHPIIERRNYPTMAASHSHPLVRSHPHHLRDQIDSSKINIHH